MINLLSPSSQQQHRAARLNLRLRSYLVAFSFVFVSVAAIFGGGLYLTLRERNIAEAQYEERENSVANYKNTRDQADEFTANLKTAKAILSHEVRYSDMITQIARELPSDAVLTTLTLDKETLSKPVTFSARVKTKDGAINLKSTLEKSTLFENVNINNIIEEKVESSETNPIRRQYPVSVTISITFTKVADGGIAP